LKPDQELAVSYSSLPIVQPLGRHSYGKRTRFLWSFYAPWSFSIGSSQVVIPALFVSDAYSFPTMLNWIPLLGSYLDNADVESFIPCFVHDWLFATGGLRETKSDEPIYSLKECNRILALSAKAEGVSWLRRKLIFDGLAIGSHIVWNRCLKAGASMESPLID